MNIEYPFYCIKPLYNLKRDRSVDRTLLTWWNEEGFENFTLTVFEDEYGTTVLKAAIHDKFVINLHFADGITTFVNKGYKYDSSEI